jgi:hypothetical protein
VSGRGECVRVNLSGRHHVEVDTQGCGLGEDVADLRFELGVKSRGAEAELVLVVLRSTILLY